jgi:hypothetical protein
MQDFRACSRHYSSRVDRITTQVTVYAGFDPAKGEMPGAPHATEALWDTGATRSFITAATANALGLVPTGTTFINHAKGKEKTNTYIVNFWLPNQVGMVGIPAAECAEIDSRGGPVIGALIGMDIIAQGDLSITNVDGKTCMSFRTPSIKKIDYVDEANKLKFAGVGRNDPCPCGNKDENGKPLKFKRCHGR